MDNKQNKIRMLKQGKPHSGMYAHKVIIPLYLVLARSQLWYSAQCGHYTLRKMYRKWRESRGNQKRIIRDLANMTDEKKLKVLVLLSLKKQKTRAEEGTHDNMLPACKKEVVSLVSLGRR